MNEVTSCRICLKHDSTDLTESLSLFTSYEGSCISDLIQCIAKVEISVGDGLPDIICPQCLLELTTAITFKRKCETSDKLLRGEIDLSIEYEEERNQISVKEEQEVQYEIDDHCADDFDHTFKIESGTESLKKESGHTECMIKKNEATDLNSIFFKNKSKYPYLKTESVEKKSKSIDLKLICDECHGSFKSKCKLRVHWKKVHLSDKLTCKTCKRVFKSYKPFNNHMRKKSLLCTLGNEINIEGYGKSRTFFCKQCPYKCNQMRYMYFHLATHTGLKTYECDICFKKFIQKGSLTIHEDTHKKVRFEIICDVCGKLVKGHGRINRHKRKHEMAKYECDLCSKRLKTKNTLVFHLQSHYNDKTHKCNKCSASFHSMTRLMYHEKFVHNKACYKHPCDMCDYVSYSKSALKKHMLKHTGSNVVCVVCGKFFDEQQKLILHQQCHNDKTYVCEYCDKKYSSKKNLQTHERNSHKVLYQKGVAERKLLRQELALEKKYACLFCDNRYGSIASRTAHVHRKHKNKVENNIKMKRNSLNKMSPEDSFCEIQILQLPNKETLK